MLDRIEAINRREKKEEENCKIINDPTGGRNDAAIFHT